MGWHGKWVPHGMWPLLILKSVKLRISGGVTNYLAWEMTPTLMDSRMLDWLGDLWLLYWRFGEMASWWSEVAYLMGGGTSSIIATPLQLNRDPFNISRAQANLSFNSTLLKRWMCPSPSSIFLFMQASCSLLFMVIGPKVCSHCIVLHYCLE